MLNCYWLPDLLEYDNIFPNLTAYDNAVYNVFKNDFVNSRPEFNGKPIYIRRHPLVNEKEQTYFHITSKDYDCNKERQLDILRCQRIKWVRKLIENYRCKRVSCKDCSGIKVWTKLQERNQIRTKILFEEKRYIVILEERNDFYLLITAYYVEYNHALKKLLKEYEKAKSASEETQSGTPSTLS